MPSDPLAQALQENGDIEPDMEEEPGDDQELLDISLQSFCETTWLKEVTLPASWMPQPEFHVSHTAAGPDEDVLWGMLAAETQLKRRVSSLSFRQTAFPGL